MRVRHLRASEICANVTSCLMPPSLLQASSRCICLHTAHRKCHSYFSLMSNFSSFSTVMPPRPPPPSLTSLQISAYTMPTQTWSPVSPKSSLENLRQFFQSVLSNGLSEERLTTSGCMMFVHAAHDTIITTTLTSLRRRMFDDVRSGNQNPLPVFAIKRLSTYNNVEV